MNAVHGRLSAVLFAVIVVFGIADPTFAQPQFTDTVGFATKTGFRGVFSWKATQPVEGLVRYGTSPTSLTQTAEAIPNTADTAGIALTEGLTIGATYYFQVEDRLTGVKSDVKSFVASNAYKDWNGSTYTLDLLVQLDLQSLPSDIPHDMAMADIAAGVNVFAERLYDAMDGYARLGRVIITDTNVQYAANVPVQPIPCQNLTNLADVLIQTTVPFDSHTFGGWRINDPCTQFYVGRIGQLIIPWEDDLHFGYVATHEMMHYAFNAPDLYPEAPNGGGGNCRNLDWDGSLMHNTGGFNNGKWELTEMDRSPTQTPCVHGTNGWSWDILRQRYTNVPADGPIDHMFEDKPRGNEDGGALEIWILDREPGSSTLTRYTPDDQNPTCGNQLPQVTDPAGDATILHAVNSSYINEPSLDVTSGRLTWNGAAKAVSFHIKVADLTDLPPVGATGHRFRFFFEYNGTRMQVRADRTPGLVPTFSLLSLEGTTLATGLTGSFNAATDTITITLSAAKLAAAKPNLPVLDQGAEMASFEIWGQRLMNAVAASANLITEIARGNCGYIVGQENFGPNAAPTAANDSASTDEDVAITIDVVANDTDPDGDALSVRSVSNPSNGTATFSGGSITYTPKANFSGSDSFTYTVTDRKGGTSGASVSVTIASVADAPTAVNDSMVAAPGTTITIRATSNDSDADGDAFAITAMSTPRSGTATHDGNDVTYTASASFSGSDAFTYTITDSTGLSSVATITISAIECLSSWSDDFEPTPNPGWRVEMQASLPVVGASPVAQKWQHIVDPLAHSPTHSFFSDASDVSASKDDNLITPPLSLTNASKLSFWHRFGFEDTFDGGVLEVSTNNGASWADVTAVGGVFEKGAYNATASAYGSPRPAYNGLQPTPIETVVHLGALGGQTALVRWRTKTDSNAGSTGWYVDDVTFTGLASTSGCEVPNNAPVANDDSASTAANTAVTVNVLANDSDPDGDPISVTATGSASNGSVTHNGSSVTYTPNNGFAGTDSFTYTVSDTFGGSDTATVTVDVNGAPTAVDDQASTNEDQTVTIDVTANDSDPNGDTLTVVSVTAPAHGTASANGDGSVSYTPAANYNGSDSFSYTVSDGRGATASATVSVTVSAVNDSPTANPDSATTTKNTAVNISVLGNDSDVDGDALQVVSVSSGMARSAVTINPNGTIRYKPRPGYTGSDTFSYTISDGNGGVSTTTVTVTITP